MKIGGREIIVKLIYLEPRILEISQTGLVTVDFF